MNSLARCARSLVIRGGHKDCFTVIIPTYRLPSTQGSTLETRGHGLTIYVHTYGGYKYLLLTWRRNLGENTDHAALVAALVSSEWI